MPFGRIRPICDDLLLADRPESEGRSDLANRFWEWSEKQVENFM